MYIVLASTEGSGAGWAYGPFESKHTAEALVEQISAQRDRDDEGDHGWNEFSWLDVLEIRNPNDLK